MVFTYNLDTGKLTNAGDYGITPRCQAQLKLLVLKNIQRLLQDRKPGDLGFMWITFINASVQTFEWLLHMHESNTGLGRDSLDSLLASEAPDRAVRQVWHSNHWQSPLLPSAQALQIRLCLDNDFVRGAWIGQRSITRPMRYTYQFVGESALTDCILEI